MSTKSPAEFLRALDRAATPGPWKFRAYRGPYQDGSMGTLWGFQHWGSDKHGKPCHFPTEENEYDNMYSPDGQLIVALRTLLPALADVIDGFDSIQGFALDLMNRLDSFKHIYDKTEVQRIILEALKVRNRLTAAVASLEAPVPDPGEGEG